MNDTSPYLVFSIALCLSFILAMAGKGSAAFMVPIFHWLGFPLNTAKAVALFGNTVSLSAASLDNMGSGRLDLRLGLPIIVFSVLFAPLGAYWSTLIPRDWLLGFFALFLLYNGIKALLPRKPGSISCHDRQPKVLYLSLIGTAAGLFSGLLAVGGGGVIAALMLWLGCKAKKIATITALAVPFSSFTGFLTYAVKGHITWPLLATVGIAALVGGFLGNRVGHGFVPEKFIKYGIGVLSIIFAIRIITDLTGWA